jgi:hypothetical protein
MESWKLIEIIVLTEMDKDGRDTIDTISIYKVNNH